MPPAHSQDPIEFLFSLERLGMKFGLENITRLCAELDHPERSFQSVIVAGTNGKGSVTAMIAAALHAAGHRSARYTSPHLERFEERFVLLGREVELGALRDAAATVQHAVERLLAAGVLSSPPTFFECTTATAFELFRRNAIGIAVLEVGLGGRLDATNVVAPIVAVIVSIDLDHQAQLGDTIESIAAEKAGVIRPGIPVVCGPLPDAADRVISDVCASQGARLIRVADRVDLVARTTGGETVATFSSGRHTFSDIRLALRGRHQAVNAAVALTLLEELEAIGVPIPEDAMTAGLTDVEWPGRLELVRWRGIDVLLDAAHNPAGARVLASYLREAGWTDVTLVFGAMQDKDVSGMIQELLPFCANIICTTASSPRARSAVSLAEIIGTLASSASFPLFRSKAIDVDAIADPREALARAAACQHRIVIAGSIFLIGPLRGILR